MIHRFPFSAPVTLSVASAPPGISGVFTPPIATGHSSSLQISVASGVSPGSYTMTVQGVGGTLTRTTDVTVVVPTPNAFSLSLPTPTRSVAQGATTFISVTIARVNFTGAITFTLENAPAGMTGFFGNNPATGASTSALLNLTVGASVPAGTYQLTIRGTSPGQNDQTVVLQVDVFVPSFFALSAAFKTRLELQERCQRRCSVVQRHLQYSRS
jgi:hypothetical protein